MNLADRPWEGDAKRGVVLSALFFFCFLVALYHGLGPHARAIKSNVYRLTPSAALPYKPCDFPSAAYAGIVVSEVFLDSGHVVYERLAVFA